MFINAFFFLSVAAAIIAVTYFFSLKKPSKPKTALPPAQPKHAQKDSFDGGFSPHATSSLALMNELYRQHKLAHSHQTDLRILSELNAQLDGESEMGAPDVTVKCKFGRVTLGGRARSAEDKVRFERIAHSINGVIDVSNQIVVIGGKKSGSAA
ncbi:MAG: BON domain-containing protein [Bdellovibrionota bacterium]